MNNSPESWKRKIKNWTLLDNKLLNPEVLTKRLAELLDIQFAEMKRAVENKGEFMIAPELCFNAVMENTNFTEILYKDVLEGNFPLNQNEIQHDDKLRKKTNVDLFKGLQFEAIKEEKTVVDSADKVSRCPRTLTLSKKNHFATGEFFCLHY